MKCSEHIIKLMYILCFCLAANALARQFSIYGILSLYASDASSDNSDEAKKVALTFDDGPHPTYTPRLLDELQKRKVNVTFFVTGENAEANPELIERMHNDGHIIGNHTYSHLQLTSYNRDSFKNELVKTNGIISGLTGAEVQYVRPPYGTWDKKLESELNMFPVLWNVDSLDWCSDNASQVASRVLKNVTENDIILMHDYYGTSVTAALIIVDELLGRGYEFVTVDKILFD